MAKIKDLKIDWLRGGKTSYPIPFGASVTIYPQSGKFVTAATTGAILSVAGSTSLAGWVEVGQWDYAAGARALYFKASATARATVANCIRDLTAVFRMPLAYQDATYTTNYAATLIGYQKDIYTSTYQYCDMTNASIDCLIIVGGLAATATAADAVIGDGYVDVMMNPALAIGV